MTDEPGTRQPAKTIQIGPEALTSEQVEGWLSDLGSSKLIIVDVMGPGLPSEGAFVPLLPWLAELRRRSIALELNLPESISSDLGFVSDNLLGTLLALYSDKIRVGGRTVSNHLERVTEHLLHSVNRVRNSSSVATVTSNLIMAPEYRAARLHHLFSTNQLGVEAELSVMASEVLQPLGVEFEADGFHHLGAFVHQALNNVYQHGFLDNKHEAIPGARFVRFRVLELDPRSTNQPVPAPMAQYLARYCGTVSAQHFLEIAIADSGRGVAATMGGNSGDTVYSQPIGYERSRFTLALQPGGSSRPNEPGGGRGLVIMTRSIHELRGFMAFRTGRLFVCRHFLDREGRLEPSRFDETDLTFYRTYDWLGSDMARASGTAVSALIPLAVANRTTDE